MSTDHSMIEPIDNLNFGNTFQRQNGQNKLQYIHKTLADLHVQLINRMS